MAAGTAGRLVSRVRRSMPGFDRPTSTRDAAYRTVAMSILGFAGAGLLSVYKSGFGAGVVMFLFGVLVLGPLAFVRGVWHVTPGTVSAVLGFVAIRVFQAGREGDALGCVLVALCWTAAATALAVRSADGSVVEPDASPE